MAEKKKKNKHSKRPIKSVRLVREKRRKGQHKTREATRFARGRKDKVSATSI